MTAQFAGFRRTSRRPAAARLGLVSAAVAGGACLVITGCSGGTGSSSAASGAAPGFHNAEGAPAALAPSARAAAPRLRAPALHSAASLTAVPAPGSQSIIYTADLSVAARHPAVAASQAARLAAAAGGYVSGEQETSGKGHVPTQVHLVLKVPVAAYRATLAALARLGSPLVQAQRAQDVTQVVADVTSRVASARAAIGQLRRLLSHAGTVGGLLTVQDQINAEEASLEALQARQRALARETAYATITLNITVPRTAAVKHHHRHLAGFTGGLAAGWRALRAAVSWLLTVLGAVLPFAIPAGLLIFLGDRARRWHARRRPSASRAD